MSVRAKLFKCVYTDIDQLFPRHHVSGYARCEFFREALVEELKNILHDELLNKLLEEKELVIVDNELIKKILGREFKEYVYVRVIIE